MTLYGVTCRRCVELTPKERLLARRLISRSRRVLELRRQLSKAERELEKATKEMEAVSQSEAGK